MPDNNISIGAKTIPWYSPITTVQLWIYSTQAWVTASGTPMNSGSPTDGLTAPQPVKKIDCTIDGTAHTCAIAAATLTSTEDADVNNTVTYVAVFVNTALSNRVINGYSVFAQDRAFRLPTDTPTTWAEIGAYNAGGLAASIPYNASVTGNLTVAGTITGNGAGITGLTGATGGVANIGSTTIGADTDINSVGVIDFQIGLVTKSRLQNDGTWDFMKNINQATLQWMFGNMVDAIRDHQAVGDGATDTTAAIQAALDAGAGKTVYIPKAAGNYMVKTNLTDCLKIPANTRVIIDGTLEAIDEGLDDVTFSAVILVNEVNTVRIEGGELIGAAGNLAGCGVVVSEGVNCAIYDMVAHDFMFDGLRTQGTPGNEPDGLGLYNFEAYNCGRQGMSASQAKRLLIQGGRFHDNTLAGVDIEPDTGTVVNGVIIYGVRAYDNAVGINVNGADAVLIGHCDVDSNTEGGISVSSAVAGSGLTKGAIVGNCRVNNNGEWGVKVWARQVTVHHCEITSHLSGYGIWFVTSWAFNGRADHNYIDNNALNGIFVGQNIPGVTLDHNEIVASGQNGITCTSSYCTITRNTLFANTLHGLFLNTTISHCHVSKNTAQQNGRHGIYVVSDVVDSSIKDNDCMENGQETNNTWDNIHVDSGCSRNTIRGNTCRKGALTNKPRYGLRINDSTCADNMVGPNDLITGGQTLPFSDVGTNTDKQGNRFTTGAMRGVATLVAGAATVSTTEIQTGDRVRLTRQATGGTPGHLSVGTITSGTSFPIASSSATDTSDVFWEIGH